MSAKHALLGLLLDRPAYPYQMADRMEQRLGPSWRVHSGSLYKTVKTMEEDGLIERVESVPTVRGDRHVYSITDGGVEEFESWFGKRNDGVRLPRRPLLLKITFAGPQRLAQAMERVDEYELECAELLNATAGMQDALPGADEQLLRADHLLLRLNLSSDIYALEGELRWSQNARDLLSWLSEQKRAVWPNGGGGDGRQVGASARSQLFTRIARATAGPGEHPTTAPEPDPVRKRPTAS